MQIVSLTCQSTRAQTETFWNVNKCACSPSRLVSSLMLSVICWLSKVKLIRQAEQVRMNSGAARRPFEWKWPYNLKIKLENCRVKYPGKRRQPEWPHLKGLAQQTFLYSFCSTFFFYFIFCPLITNPREISRLSSFLLVKWHAVKIATSMREISH